MSEAVLLWLQGACTVLQILAIGGVFGGLIALCAGVSPLFTRIGAWVMVVSIVLVVVLPWPPLWSYWLKLVRMP